jgi:Zn-dependent M16 (insulinase) family peptidase
VAVHEAARLKPTKHTRDKKRGAKRARLDCYLTVFLLLLLNPDPNLLDTLTAYDGTVDFLRSLEMDKDALTKAIIGTMGDIDAYQLPDSKGYAALSR